MRQVFRLACSLSSQTINSHSQHDYKALKSLEMHPQLTCIWFHAGRRKAQIVVNPCSDCTVHCNPPNVHQVPPWAQVHLLPAAAGGPQCRSSFAAISLGSVGSQDHSAHASAESACCRPTEAAVQCASRHAIVGQDRHPDCWTGLTP